MNKNHIFIDTNVLIGAASGNKTDKDCLNWLSSIKGKQCYISALSVAQFASVFQKKKNNIEIKKYIINFLHKYNVIAFTKEDIENAIIYEQKDIEDNIQYVLGTKLKCMFFITNNYKDYRHYMNIRVFKPSQVKMIDC